VIGFTEGESPMLRAPLVLLVLLLAGCEEPAATAPSGPLNHAQAWSLCQDPGRGLAAANACTALIEAGQETRQGLISAHYDRAMALGRRGRTQAALADYDIVLSMDPNFALALYQRALIYQQQGQSARAEMDLRRARQLDPHLPQY
jgi:tetratricopeptide (TPR) repeat protein